MKILILVIFALFQFSSFAGDKIGNGGGTWSCKTSPRAPATKLMFVDFFEAREQHGWTIRSAPRGIVPLDFAEQMLNEFEQELPSYASVWKLAFNQTKASIRFVNADLEIVDDALFQIRPESATCVGTWTYTQFANFNTQGQVLVSNSLWSSPLISVEEKAGLIWHEAIYYWLRTSYQDTDSRRAREITGLLFSNQPIDQKRKQLGKILVAPAPQQANWFCSTNNDLTSRVFGGYGPSELEARTAAVDSCRGEGYSYHCNDSTVTCEQAKSQAASWSCVADNELKSESYIGRGRSQLEARFRSVENCQLNSGTDGFHCTTAAPVCSPL